MRAAAALLWLFVALAPAAAWDGEVLPRDFAPVLAPPNTLYLPFWGSTSNSIELAEVKPEEAAVRAGDVVAVFKFGADRAQVHLKERAAQLAAERDEELLAIKKRIQELRTAVARMKLEREKVRLDMLRADGLAKVKSKLLELDYREKALETEATEQRLAAACDELKWSDAVHATRIRAWDTLFTIFASTKERYTVKAPVAGKLFYPTLERSNRKVRNGDDMNSGAHFLSIVQSDRAQVRFFVPEPEGERVREGDAVLVESTGRAPVRAKVVAKDVFPQYVGDARRNFRLPDAWEKCFVVVADLDDPFSKIAKKDVTVTREAGR